MTSGSDSNSVETGGIRRILWLVDRGLTGLVKVVLVLAFGSILILSGAQALLRNFSISVPDGIDPFLHRMVLWVGLLGAVLAVRSRSHIKLDLAAHLLSPTVQHWVEKGLALVSAGVCGRLAMASWVFVMSERDAALGSGGELAMLGPLPMWAYTGIIPVAFGLMGVSFLFSLGLPPVEATLQSLSEAEMRALLEAQGAPRSDVETEASHAKTSREDA